MKPFLFGALIMEVLNIGQAIITLSEGVNAQILKEELKQQALLLVVLSPLKCMGKKFTVLFMFPTGTPLFVTLLVSILQMMFPGFLLSMELMFTIF